MAKATPMMEQYRQIKKENPDAIIFFRMGDFYEMFDEDAVVASRELDIVLTSKNAGEEGKVPMCGVPYHAVDSYVARLIDRGFRVAICEQMEDPKLAKGLVKREVTRIVSPGTVLEEAILSEQSHSYLATMFAQKDDWGFCYTDISTGEFKATEFRQAHGDSDRVYDEICRLQPREVLVAESFYDDPCYLDPLKRIFHGLITPLPNSDFQAERAAEVLATHFETEDAQSLFLPPLAMSAAGATIAFLNRSQKRSLSYIHTIHYYESKTYMVLDPATRRNLELTATIMTNQKKGSLLGVMDKTCNVMGKRLLREWLDNPLLNLAQIQERQDAVKELFEKPFLVEELKEFLFTIHDLERLSSRIAFGNGNPREMVALRLSLQGLPTLREILYKLKADAFQKMADAFDDLHDVCANIATTLVDDPPISPKEGGFVREGYAKEIDECRSIASSGQQMLRDIEAREREATGIKSLKVGFNRVFGYYIEVSNANKSMVPDHYIRKQTLTNGERYFTEELKEYEDKILGAKDRLYQMEYDVFCRLRDYISHNAPRIQLMASFIAIVDVLRSFAVVATEHRYCCPKLDDSDAIIIENGRHPTVEQISSEAFIANDTYLDQQENRVMVITGPNMAGKSTYMRQVALIVLLAQVGAFVPASSARIGLVDRIFTRIGASDDLVGGDSTFMVEMKETAEILKYATEKSLIVLDEIGRGTSTFDGLAIAWACIEYLADASVAPKTLFATHYHELTNLENDKATLKNYAIAVEEINGELVFLRKIDRGRADKSYGIQVAKLAGMPLRIVNQAKKILRALEKTKINEPGAHKTVQEELALFKELTEEKEEVLTAIERLDLDNLKPLQALSLLAEWQDLLKHHHEE